jgi:exopolysaccharide production protein ExoQ
MDWWRVLYGSALVSMVAVVSSSPALAEAFFIPRLLLVGALAVFTWVHRPRLSRSLGEASRWLVVGLWAVVAAAAVSSVWSLAMTETAAQTVVLACLAAIVHGGLTRRWATVPDVLDDLAVAYWVVVAASAASLMAYFAGVPSATGLLSGRMHGIFGNPNMLGALAGVALVLGIALTRQKATVWRTGGLAILALALLLSQARTSLIAVLVAAIWLFLKAGPRRAILIAYSVALLASVWAFLAVVLRAPMPALSSLPSLDRFTQYGTEGALSARDVIWETTLLMWRDQPWTGIGYAAAPIALPERAGISQYAVDSVHNGYLQWLLETGILGAIPLTVALVAALRPALLSKAGVPAAAAGAVVVCGLVIQFAESALLGTGQPFPYLFWIAAAAATVHLDNRHQHGRVESRNRLLARSGGSRGAAPRARNIAAVAH